MMARFGMFLAVFLALLAGPASAQTSVDRGLPSGWAPMLDRFLADMGISGDRRAVVESARTLKLRDGADEDGLLIRLSHPSTCRGERCLVIDAVVRDEMRAALMFMAGPGLRAVDRCLVPGICVGVSFVTGDGQPPVTVFVTPRGVVLD